MAGIIHTTFPRQITRRRMLTGTAGVFAGVAVGRSALAQDGTATPAPSSIPAGGPERIQSLLTMVPADLGAQAAQGGVIFYYADLKRQLESLNIPSYESGSDDVAEGFIEATSVLAIAAQSFQYGLEPEFISTFGFTPFQAEESMSVGNSPNDLTIFRGGLPIEDLPAVWEASGYARETSESGVDIWTAGKEGELDLTTNVSQYGLGGLNNVAIFGETIVFSRFFSDIEAVAAQVAEPDSSIFDQANLTDLLATLSGDTVSAVATTGQFLDLVSLLLPEMTSDTFDLIDEAAEKSGEMPEVRGAMFAITAGASGPSFVATGEGTPDASPASNTEPTEGGIVEVRLLTDSDDEAATAAESVDYRWNSWTSPLNEQPYTDLMSLISAEPDPEIGNVAAIDFRGVQSNRVWIDMVLLRDLLPFAWAGDLPTEATPTAAG